METGEVMAFQGAISNANMLYYSTFALLTCALLVATVFLLISIFEKEKTDG